MIVEILNKNLDELWVIWGMCIIYCSMLDYDRSGKFDIRFLIKICEFEKLGIYCGWNLLIFC